MTNSSQPQTPVKFIALYTRVLTMLGSDRQLGWSLAIANVVLAMAMFAEPILFGLVIDTLSRASLDDPAGIWPALGPLLFTWVGFGLFTISCGAVIALFADRLSHRRRHLVLRDYFEHVLQLPLAQQADTHSGRLMKTMLQGTDALWWLWLSFFRDHLAAAVSLIVLVPVALYINWRLALVLIVLCIIFVGLTHFILRKTQALQQQVEGHHSDLAEQASDTLGNIALVQSFARIEHEVSALKDISQRVLGAQMPVLSWWALVNVLTRSSTTLSILCIVALGAWLFTKGLTTVGAIVTFISFSGMVIMRLEQIVGFVHRLAMEAPRLQEFFHILDTESSIHDAPHAIDPGRVRGAIAFENVTFAYDKKHPAVRGLSFTLKPGSTIALVGASGAGKSTALSLLYRAFDPQSGRITVDGHDIRDLKLGALRSNIGVVFQEALLFNRSIADNLKVGLPDATEAQLRQACASAQALDFILQHPQGFDTKIGERGRALSGGERQRLSIARVLLKNPPILILDEATSALDSATETKLLQALDAVTKDRSTLVIAHRLATIRKADQILVMDHGSIVEAGSFDELYAQGGRFTQLVKEQFSDAAGNFIT
jgi:ATP-binding cassette subfamily B protein